MNVNRTAVRDRAYSDVMQSSRVGPVPWNRQCVHNMDVKQLRDDMRRLTVPSAWGHVSGGDIKRLRELCRCCIRIVPDWPRLVADATDACFSFPDEIARGLLWRSVVFAIWMDQHLKSGVAASIKDKVARHLAADGELSNVIVDGFLDMLESKMVASDVGLTSD